MTCCPLCGSAAELNFNVRLETNTAFIGPSIIQLAPKEAEILSVLVDSWPKRLPTESIFTKVWGHLSDIQPKIVRVIVCNLNEKLAQLGYIIDNTPGSRSGYLLTKIQPMTRGEYRGKQRRQIQVQRLAAGARVSA